MRNARVWVYVGNSPCKITVRSGQVTRWSRSRRDEEGYSHVAYEWSLEDDDEVVVEKCWYNGADCDGRVSRDTVREVTIDQLKHRPSGYMAGDEWVPGDPDIQWPNWKEQSQYQRDYAAEAMGY